LELSRDISGLNLSIARIGESLMSPASPVSGVVERVYVRVGQVVNPGQTLFTIQGNSNQLKAMVELPGNLALKVSEYDATDFLIDDQIFKVVPTHISREAVAGRQFAATYYLPEDLHGHYLSDGQYISVKIPVGQAQSTATLPLIPIDCVHQLQDKAYVFVIKDGLAQSQEIELGDVFGSMVEIRSGLTDVAQIIRSRNVISGDKVQVE
jgi:multidrug efflux pump subunit AcrA (membrane-fusion protein)